MKPGSVERPEGAGLGGCRGARGGTSGGGQVPAGVRGSGGENSWGSCQALEAQHDAVAQIDPVAGHQHVCLARVQPHRIGTGPQQHRAVGGVQSRPPARSSCLHPHFEVAARDLATGRVHRDQVRHVAALHPAQLRPGADDRRCDRARSADGPASATPADVRLSGGPARSRPASSARSSSTRTVSPSWSPAPAAGAGVAANGAPGGGGGARTTGCRRSVRRGAERAVGAAAVRWRRGRRGHRNRSGSSRRGPRWLDRSVRPAGIRRPTPSGTRLGGRQHRLAEQQLVVVDSWLVFDALRSPSARYPPARYRPAGSAHPLPAGCDLTGLRSGCGSGSVGSASPGEPIQVHHARLRLPPWSFSPSDDPRRQVGLAGSNRPRRTTAVRAERPDFMGSRLLVIARGSVRPIERARVIEVEDAARARCRRRPAATRPATARRPISSSARPTPVQRPLVPRGHAGAGDQGRFGFGQPQPGGRRAAHRHPHLVAGLEPARRTRAAG